MKAYIFDCETTGKDPQTALPIQASAIEVAIMGGTVNQGPQRTVYYEQTRESDYGALATHGISLNEIANMDAVIPGADFSLGQTAPDIKYMIGHNIEYDWQVCGSSLDVVKICTLKIMRWLHPDWEHSLGACYLRIMDSYFGDLQLGLQKVRGAHNAEDDVRLNFTVLQYICATQKIDSVETLWAKYNQTWRYPVCFPMGKHKGRLISEVVKEDRGYFAWVLKQADMDPDLQEACRRVL